MDRGALVQAVVFLCLFGGGEGYSQSAKPAFDVVSVKAAPLESTYERRNHVNTGGPGTPNPGRVEWFSVSLFGFLTEAYNLKPFQLSGPDWLASTKIDLTASVPPNATKQEYRLMLQRVLEERFFAKVHFEKREGLSYILTVGKHGSKMQEFQDEPSLGDAKPVVQPGSHLDSDGFTFYPEISGVFVSSRRGSSRIRSTHGTMERLAAILTAQLGRPVEDVTGLKGKYDFFVTFASAGTATIAQKDGSAGVVAESLPDPDLIDAVDQVGLRLEQKKTMIDVLVIDRLEKVPTDN